MSTPKEVKAARSIINFNQQVFGHVDPAVKDMVVQDLQVALAYAKDSQDATAIRAELANL